MSEDIHIIRRMLRTTALCGMLALLATPAFAQTFNPSTDSAAAPPRLEPLATAILPPNPPSTDPGVLSPRAAMGVPTIPSRPDPAPAIAARPIISHTSEPTPTVAYAPEHGYIAPVPAPFFEAAPVPGPAPAPAPVITPAPVPTHVIAAPVVQPVTYAAKPVTFTAPTPVVVTPPAPAFPPVDPAVAREAQREIAAQPSIIAPLPDFSAPAPLVAPAPAPAIVTPVAATRPVVITPVATAPVIVTPIRYETPQVVTPAANAPAIITPAPAAVSVAAPVPAPIRLVAPPVNNVDIIEPAPQQLVEDTPLSPATKATLHKLPSKIDTPPKTPTGHVTMSNRMSGDIQQLGGDDVKPQSYDAVGLSIKVAKPGIDTNFELNRAYTALMGGDNQTAIDIYKRILASFPQNQDALFGLASTYHRNGELEKARPYYSELLKINPNHREGLNNFLALVAEESPNEALAELARLEQRNRDFSPIPAQEALVMNKLGYHEQAREKMLRAIELAPENFTYKYDLAIMLDQQGDYVDAGALYRLLIDASLRGEKLPASTDTLQKRLNYISTATPPVATNGN